MRTSLCSPWAQISLSLLVQALGRWRHPGSGEIQFAVKSRLDDINSGLFSSLQTGFQISMVWYPGFWTREQTSLPLCLTWSSQGAVSQEVFSYSSCVQGRRERQCTSQRTSVIHFYNQQTITNHLNLDYSLFYPINLNLSHWKIRPVLF